MDLKIRPDLNTVYADQTKISQIDHDKKVIGIRGHSLAQLVDHGRFEDVCYLLWNYKLPRDNEESEFIETEIANRVLSQDEVHFLIENFSAQRPIDTIRTFISYLGAKESESRKMCEPTTLFQLYKLLGKLPSAVAFLYRHSLKRPIIAPSDTLNNSDNLLYMSLGGRLAHDARKAFSACRIAFCEHGFSAATFTARMITSSNSDLYSALTGAISCFKGPLQAGALESVDEMFANFEVHRDPILWLNMNESQKKPVPGFGHPSYPESQDFRVEMIRDSVLKVCRENPKMGRILVSLETIEPEVQKRYGLYSNSDLYLTLLYRSLGFPREYYVPISMLSRFAGWGAHILEQTKSARVIRPQSIYNGPPLRLHPEQLPPPNTQNLAQYS